MSSVNLAEYDSWKANKQFIDDLITMLDNVLEHFIEYVVDTSQLGEYNANYRRFKSYLKEDKHGLHKAAFSAYRERSIGLGAMGFHAFLQSKGVSFEGLQATSYNYSIFKDIKKKATKATKRLAEERGSYPDSNDGTSRHAHLLAIAPNASSSIICGGTSPSIEPMRANIYTHKTLSGTYSVKNKYLDDIINKKFKTKKEIDDVWKDISIHQGSVQHVDFLSTEEKEIFKTAEEINQIWIVEHAYKRQEFVCQAQSVNLFFNLPAATELQQVHDDYLQYVHDVHWYAMHNLKSLYYFRSNAAKTAENVNIKIPRIKLDDVECVACEG